MRVLIVEDHPLVRDALARIVHQLDPQADVQEADRFEGLAERIAGAMPDLLLLDLNLPDLGGLAALHELRERFPSLTTVVASGQDDPATIRAVLGAGAGGFIPKSDPPALVLHALRIVLGGSVYVPARALGDFRNGVPPPAVDTGGLTPRQLDVLRLLLRGQPNKLIARALGLTEGTVKIHIAAILRALNARNRTEAVLHARARPWPADDGRPGAFSSGMVGSDPCNG